MTAPSVPAGHDDAGAGRPLTALITPLPEELAALRGIVEGAATRRIRGRRFIVGRLAGAPVVLAVTGDARLSAARGLIALLDAFPVDRLIVLGTAGGLSPRLTPGDLILALRVREGASDAPAPDAAWLERALGSGRALAGTVITSDFILPYPEMKAALWRTLPDGGPATVDLETAVYARLAARRGVPYLAVRAVLDPAEEALPMDFNLCRRRDGRVSRGRVARRALLRPGRFGELLRLRRRVRLCSERLAALAGELVAA